jgi:RNA polymerase sigma factor (TIGR02999 family)
MAQPRDISRDQTSLLDNDWQSGRRAAMDELMPVIYDDLRRMARAFLRRERPGHTLQPTALVNEVYLRLVGQRTVSWASRAQFFGLAATMMRRILVNHAEAKRAAKRGGRLEQMTIDPLHAMSEPAGLDVMALNEALERLSAVDPEKARIIEMRFFGGLTNDEVAEVLGRSRATIEREWSFARAWLYRHLSG